MLHMKGGVVSVLWAYGQPKEAALMRHDVVPCSEQLAKAMRETLESLQKDSTIF
jgi:hypothetical protein